MFTNLVNSFSSPFPIQPESKPRFPAWRGPHPRAGQRRPQPGAPGSGHCGVCEGGAGVWGGDVGLRDLTDSPADIDQCSIIRVAP